MTGHNLGVVLFQYLGDIEDHLGVTIDQANSNMKVQTNEFDGKVTYGQKRKNAGKLKLSVLLNRLHGSEYIIDGTISRKSTHFLLR